MIEMMIDVKQMMLRVEQMVRRTTCCQSSAMHPKKSRRDATERESPNPQRRNVAKKAPSPPGILVIHIHAEFDEQLTLCLRLMMKLESRLELDSQGDDWKSNFTSAKEMTQN